jgi:hypothetical protein
MLGLANGSGRPDKYQSGYLTLTTGLSSSDVAIIKRELGTARSMPPQIRGVMTQ